MKTRRFKVLMIGFVTVFFLITSIAFGQAPIKIGLIATLTGTYAQPGADSLNGANFYLEKIGHNIGGHKVELFSEDEEASASVALTKARKLVELNKVHVLIGPILAGGAYAVQPYQESKGVPDIHIASGDDLTQRMAGKWTIRISFSGSQAMHPFGEYAYKVLGLRKVAVVAADYAFGWEVVGGFHKSFEDMGGKIVQKLWFPISANDFSPYVTQIRKDADAMFSQMGGRSAVMLNKQFQEYGLKGKIASVGLMQITDESILPAMGDEAVGIITAGFYSGALDTPVNKEFVKAYNKRFGKIPSMFSVMYYDAMAAINQAVTSLKGDIGNPENLMKALKAVNLKDSPRGPLKLDAYGNPLQNIYIRKTERVGGQLQNTVIHTYPEVSQFWTYKPEEFLKQPVYSRDYPPMKP